MEVTCTICKESFKTREGYERHASTRAHIHNREIYDAGMEAGEYKLRARVAELEKFLRDFLDNFETCEHCTGGLLNGDTCPKCKGTGEQIDSIGILYVDLPEKARELLGE